MSRDGSRTAGRPILFLIQWLLFLQVNKKEKGMAEDGSSEST